MNTDRKLLSNGGCMDCGELKSSIRCKLDAKVFYSAFGILVTVLICVFGVQTVQLGKLSDTASVLSNTVATLTANQKTVMAQQLEQAQLNYKTLETQAILATSMGNLGERLMGLEKEFKAIERENRGKILR